MRYRVDYPVKDDQPRPVRPDIAFPRIKLAVFVDGCFWHGCPDHGQRSGGSNASYWSPKIARNQERDEEQTARLERAGWMVLRLWEHEPLERVLETVLAAVQARRADGEV